MPAATPDAPIRVGIAIQSTLDREVYAGWIGREPGYAVRRPGDATDADEPPIDVWLADRCLGDLAVGKPVVRLPARDAAPSAFAVGKLGGINSSACRCCQTLTDRDGVEGLLVTLADAVGRPRPRLDTSLERLSRRERDILRLAGYGKSVPEAAALLGVAPSTVSNHKHRLMRKLGVSTSLELLRIAVRAGLAPLD